MRGTGKAGGVGNQEDAGFWEAAFGDPQALQLSGYTPRSRLSVLETKALADET